VETTDHRAERTSKDVDNKLEPIGHFADQVETGNDLNWDPLVTVHLCQQVLVTGQVLSVDITHS